MSLSTYPVLRGLTFTSLKTPEFATTLFRAPNGYETRLANTINPIWHWGLIYDFLLDDPTNIQAAYTPSGGSIQAWPSLIYTDLKTLMGFYLSMQGQYGQFLYTDPDDHAVAFTDQTLQVVASAGVSYTPIQRFMNGFYEDITDLNGAISVKANGVAKTGGGVDYTLSTNPGLALPTVSYMGQYLTWGGATPTPAPPITASFSYYFRARFETDTVDFEKFIQQMWTIGGSESKEGSGSVKLMTARPAPL